MSEGNFIIPDSETIEYYGTSMNTISSSVETTLEGFSSDVYAFEEEVNGFCKRVEDKLEELKTTIQEIENEINNLDIEIKQYQDVCDENTQKIFKLKEQENQIKQQIHELEEEIRRIERTEEENKQQKIAQLKAKLLILKQKQLECMQSRVDLENHNQNIKSKLIYLKNTRDEFFQKQQLYICKYSEISDTAKSFYEEWTELKKGVESSNIINNVSSAKEDLMDISNFMKNLAISVRGIEWGYSNGKQ